MAAAHSTTAQVREDRAIYRAMKLLEGRLRKPGESLTNVSTVRHFITLHLGRESREVFTAIWLDTQHRLITVENLFFGTLRETTVYPREVVRSGLLRNAASVIFSHNHPSGVPNPSWADLKITCALKSALEVVDIRAIDHFIVGGATAVSLVELGLFGLSDFPAPEEPSNRKTQSKKARAKR